MAIVVLARGIKPIDLTASLLLAYEYSMNGISSAIEWIVEETSPTNVYDELLKYAHFFSPKFDITVKRQREVPELFPDTKEIISTLYDLLENLNYDDVRVRIQHGAILVTDGDHCLAKCRYFGKNAQGMLVLFDDNKHNTKFVVEKYPQLSLSLQGSMNLLFLSKYGQLAHLPWYCIDSPIKQFTSLSVILPPEGCSYRIFNTNTPFLTPSGYSIQDYYEKNHLGTFLDHIMEKSGRMIFSRKENGTNRTQAVLRVIENDVRKQIIQLGFETILREVSKPCLDVSERITNLVKICILSRLMVSYDRGYPEQTRPFSLVDSNGLLYCDRCEILASLLSALQMICHEIDYPHTEALDQIHSDIKPFGKIADNAHSAATYYYNRVFSAYFYGNKATISKLIEHGKTLDGVLSLFNHLLHQRGEFIHTSVEGSIFEYESYHSELA